MRKRTSLFALALLVGSATAAAVRARSAQDEPTMPQPTEHHALIQKGVGSFEGTLTSFYPGMPAEPIPASETVAAIGPFWTQSTFECLFMGQPYLGTGCVGYDAEQQKFVGTWIDSMSSHLAVMEGELSEDGVLVMRWQAPGWTGAMEQHRSETVRSDDGYTMTFFMGEGDAAAKTMVIDMRRTEPAAAEAAAQPVEAGSGR